MSAKGLFKFRTVVAYLLVISPVLIAAFLIFSDTVAQAESGSGITIAQPIKGECREQREAASKAYDQFLGACINGENQSEAKKCINEALKCREMEKELGSSTSDEGSGEDDCNAIASKGCPDLAGSSEELKADKKEAKENRKDLQKQRDDAQKESQDKQNKAQEDANKADDDALKADQEYRKQRKELTDKLQEQLAKIDQQKAEAIKQAQKSYDEVDMEYIKIRNDLRRGQSDMTNMDLSWTVQCRNAANAKAQDEEKKLDARMAEEDAMIRNYQLSSSAGKLKRALKKKRDKIVLSFNEYLARCLKGDVDPGSQIKLQLDSKKNKVRDDQSEANDRSARLEKLRLQILQNLQQAQQSMDKQTQMITQQTQEAIQMLDQDHQMNANRAQQKKMQAMQNAMQQQMTQGQNQKRIDDDLADAKESELNASARAKCNPLNKETRDDIKARRKQVVESRAVLYRSCLASRSCLGKDVANICPIVEKAVQRTKKDENSREEAKAKATR